MTNSKDNPLMDLVFRSLDPSIKTIKIRNDFSDDGKIITKVTREDFLGNINTNAIG